MKKDMHPSSLMMSHGYQPEWSEGSIKPPIFQTSTFTFKTAEEGKAFFELAYGIRTKEQNEQLGLIYSRINNPNLEILEDRLCLWDKADDCAVFESGMAAISTVFLAFLKPGDTVLFSSPTYGGTDHFIHSYLKEIGVQSIPFYADEDEASIKAKVLEAGASDSLRLIYIETPANPTNALIDIEACRHIANELSPEQHIPIAVDNTYMGPLWSSPLSLGADLVIYSATKYIGGHSDIIAGAVLGHSEVMTRVRTLRTFLGNMASPHTSWLLTRSLETLQVRMQCQQDNAMKVADFLNKHPKIKKVYYLGLMDANDPQYEVYLKQYDGPGAMLAFDVVGGEREAFDLLNHLDLIKLAVSLGSTESLAQHPATMTHIAVAQETKDRLGISPSLVRLSVGIERAEDLIQDLSYALSHVNAGAVSI